MTGDDQAPTAPGRSAGSAASVRRLRAFAPLMLFFLAPALARADATQGAVASVGCRAAAQAEIERGRRPVRDVEQMLDRGVLLFNGTTDGGDDEQVVYRCAAPQEPPLARSVQIATSDAARAWQAYAREQAALRDRFGEPTVDSHRFGLLRRMLMWQRYAPAFSAFEYTSWRPAASRQASVSIRKSRTAFVWLVTAADGQPAQALPAARDLPALAEQALALALCTMALTGALVLTPLARHRWLVATTVPLALVYEALWSLGGSGPENARSAAQVAPDAAACLLPALGGSLLVAWLLRRKAPEPAQKAAGSGHSGALEIALGVALLAGLVLWLQWLFAPGAEVPRIEGQPPLRLALAPLALLAATALGFVGTRRLVAAHTAAQARPQERALEYAGVVLSVVGATACLSAAIDLLVRAHS